MTNFSMPTGKYLQLGTAVAILATTVVCMVYYFCTTSIKSPYDELIDYTEEFASQYYQKHPDLEELDAMKMRATAADGPEGEIMRVLHTFVRHTFEEGHQMESIEYLRNAISILSREPHPTFSMAKFNAYCYLMLGAAYDEAGLYSLSKSYYFKGLEISESIGDEIGCGDFYNNLGVTCLRLDKVEEAEKYFDKVIEICNKHGENHLQSVVYNNLCEVYTSHGDYNKAIDVALRSMQHIDEELNPFDYYLTQTMIGEIYMRMNRPELCYTYLKNAFINLKRIDNPQFLFETCVDLMSYFSMTGMADSVSKYDKLAESIAAETGYPDHKLRLLQKRADVEEQAGHLSAALALQHNVYSLKDSIYNEENAARIEQANYLYSIERKMAAEISSMRKWNPVVVFISMGMLVTVLVVLIVWLMKLKRQNEMASRKESDALRKYAESQKTMLEDELLKHAQMREEIDLHNRKLTSYTLERIHTNECLEDISNQIKQLILKISPRDKESQTMLREVLSKLGSLKSEAHWEEFQYYFNKVHPAFYQKLEANHPELTTKDRRLCALLSLGLTTKDIASITFREVRSVESSRSRLRKKLNLENDETLGAYISSLTQMSG